MPRKTTRDVAILHQIITSAEQHSEVETKPFRAIFAAYDSVLAQNGLDPDRDQLYLRFLLRLGDKKNPDLSLYESFELLLGELGIQIEFDPEDDGIQDVTRDLSAVDRSKFENTATSGAGSGPPRHSRRASFTSMYDVGEESRGANGSRVRSRASESQLQLNSRLLPESQPPTRESSRPAEGYPKKLRRSQSTDIQPRRGRLTAQEFASNLQHLQNRQVSATSHVDRAQDHVISNGHHVNLQTRSQPQPAGNATTTASDSEYAGEASDFSQGIRSSVAGEPWEIFHCPSKTQLLRDVDTFQHYQIRSIARRWFAAALQASNDRRLFEQKAVAHDTGILIRQAFQHWRQLLYQKQQVAETHRFFNRLEQRAGKARDLFLLTKAFTHWGQCAYEEAVRTSTARRHILRLKYFNSWLDVTAVNALKVRRQKLWKFFGLWKKRYEQISSDDTKAVTLNKKNLYNTAYWRWFWTFCDRRAPEWRSARLKSKYFTKWVLILRQISRREDLVTTRFDDKIKRSDFGLWLSKTRVVLSHSQSAANLSCRRLVANSLSRWRVTTCHAPLVRQVSNMVDWRVAGTTFGAFVARYRFERQAEGVSRQRLVRNAWTDWNDRLRWQTLTRQIDDRMVVEALYRWVLAERYVLLYRLHKQRLKIRYLSSLLRYVFAVQAQRISSFQVVERRCDRINVCSILVRWRQQLKSIRQDKEVAFEFHAPRIAQESLQLWTAKSAHLRKLKCWAKDADYYFVATKFVKRWRTAVIEHRRQKRRNAYTQIRRKSKMGLASRVISQWRLLTSELQGLQAKANRTNQDRLLRYATGLFDDWRTRFHLTANRDYQAEEHYAIILASNHLNAWRNRLTAHRKLEELANFYLEPQLSSLASSWLHKFRLRMIEFKGQEGIATSFKNTYEKRHLRRYLRHWQDQTVARSSRRQVPPASHRKFHSPAVTIQPPKPISTLNASRRLALQAEVNNPDNYTNDNDDPAFSLTTRAEEWTALDLGDWVPALEAHSSTTPLPGYLSTPSKRAARARALAGSSTTPAGTPFERGLRSQLGAEPRTGKRRGVVFRGLREEEGDPRTPGVRSGLG